MEPGVQAVRPGPVVWTVTTEPGPVLWAALAAQLDGVAGALVIRQMPVAVPPWTPGADAGLAALCDRLAAHPHPVVVALEGQVPGAWLAIALAAGARVAAANTRLTVPGVALGLVPVAGVTQRLPRLIGPEAALAVLLPGRPVLGPRALELGLIDRLEPDPLAAALALIRAGLPVRPPPPEAQIWFRAVSAARKSHQDSRLPVHARLIDCVEAAALLPGAQGHAYELAAAEDLLGSSEVLALRHAEAVERQTPLPQVAAPVVVGILGAEPRGLGLALACLSAGVQVRLVDADPASLARGVAAIAKLQEAAVAAGRMSAARLAADQSRLLPGRGPQDLDGCGLVLVAPAEPLPPGPVLAIGEARGSVPGLWVQPPSHAARLVEVLVPQGADRQVVQAGVALARRLGKLAVLTGPLPGGISGRLWAAGLAAAEAMVINGANPDAVDAAMRAWGMTRGPFERADAEGLAAICAMADPGALPLTSALRGAGRSSWYRYEGRAASTDPAVTAVVMAARVPGIRGFGAAEIQTRILVAMAIAGAQALALGQAARPADIDLAMLGAGGFPRWQGGPMHWADGFGLLQLARAAARHADLQPGAGEPPPGIEVMIRNGWRFADLNG